VPTLVVVGSQDAGTPPPLGEQIRAAIPGAQLATIDAAHEAAAEQPHAFCDTWRRFADGQSS
jgi:pimeloyl-ACP methyl ester carboxylesterase